MKVPGLLPLTAFSAAEADTSPWNQVLRRRDSTASMTLMPFMGPNHSRVRPKASRVMVSGELGSPSTALRQFHLTSLADWGRGAFQYSQKATTNSLHLTDSARCPCLRRSEERRG